MKYFFVRLAGEYHTEDFHWFWNPPQSRWIEMSGRVPVNRTASLLEVVLVTGTMGPKR